MVAIAQEYGLMFQLRNNLYSQLEIPLQNALELLSNDIKTFLLSDKKIERQTEDVLAQIFNLRIKAAKWLSVNFDSNILEVIQDIMPQIEQLSTNPQLEVLTENILFALRCNKRVAESIMTMQNIDNQANNQKHIHKNIHKNNQTENSINVGGFEVPNITYNQLKASLAYVGGTFAEKVMSFINNSLNIEWVILATDIISDNKMVVSDEKINELCSLVIYQAEEYMDIALELGYLAQPIREIEIDDTVFDDDFIKEQKELADLGLEDWINL